MGQQDGSVDREMRSQLEIFIEGVPGFAKFTHAERIRVFAWFLHFHLKRDRFAPSDIVECYELLSMEQPSSVAPFLTQMEKSKPKKLLKDSRGSYLEHSLFQALSAKYAEREITIQVSRLLETLPAKVPDHAEREFLQETLTCYRRGAFRASVVMIWNLPHRRRAGLST